MSAGSTQYLTKAPLCSKKYLYLKGYQLHRHSSISLDINSAESYTPVIACKGRVTSDETKKKLSVIRKGKKGHYPTPDTRRKLAEACRRRKGETRSSITKQRISDKRKGQRWWNNGSIVKSSVDCPGEGWVLGRMKAYGCAAINQNKTHLN